MADNLDGFAAGPARAPLAAERRDALLALLHEQGSLRVADAAARLDVTPMTVRRDIVALELEGRLRRVHGGAMAIPAKGGQDAPAAATSVHAPATAPTSALGVMVPTLDYHWPGIVAGIEAAARAGRAGVVLRVSSYAVEDERPTLERIAANPAVGGLVLAPRLDDGHGAEVTAWLERSGLPAVLVERNASTVAGLPSADSVTTDHARGVRLVVEHLAGLGHRRVGIVLTRSSPTSDRLAAAWHDVAVGLLGDGAADPQHLPARSDPDFPAAVEAVITAAREHGTTALLVHSDPEAFAIVQRAEELGLRVPQDLSVVAYDDERAGQLSPPLTAVRPPREALGEAAVELVLARIADPARPARSLTITPSLVVRATSGPAPAPSVATTPEPAPGLLPDPLEPR